MDSAGGPEGTFRVLLRVRTPPTSRRVGRGVPAIHKGLPLHFRFYFYVTKD